MLETMYPAAVNSRQTELAEAIDDAQTSFTVLDGSVLPPAPNLLTLGTDDSAETVLYTAKTGNEVTGVTRGFESEPKSWAAGTKLARFFTAYDHDTFRGNITDLDQRLSDIAIPPASLTEQGIVMLSKSTTGNRDDVAATESAVAAAFQYGVERKAEVVAALNSIGVLASTSESWDQLIPKIAAVIRATGNATAAQVLAGSSFSNSGANGLAGSMVNRGAVSQDITTQNGSYTVPQGYHSGLGVIRAVFANLIAANIRNGVNIGGVVGSMSEGIKYAKGTALSSSATAMGSDSNGGTRPWYQLIFTGLSFRPAKIIVRRLSDDQRYIAGTYTDTGYTPLQGAIRYAIVAGSRQGTSYDCIMGDTSFYNFHLTDTGFSYPVDVGNINYVWEAFGS